MLVSASALHLRTCAMNRKSRCHRLLRHLFVWEKEKASRDDTTRLFCSQASSLSSQKSARPLSLLRHFRYPFGVAATSHSFSLDTFRTDQLSAVVLWSLSLRVSSSFALLRRTSAQ